jgi:hypothetical protein
MAEKAPAQTGERIQPELRADPDIRRRMSGPAMRAFFGATGVWNLTPKEKQGILGWPPSSTFYKYQAGDVGTLSLDALTRISLVLGIFKDLRILYTDRGLSDRWVKLPNSNPMFGGQLPIAFIARGEMDNLYRVRRLLDARRGSWN